MKKYVDNYSLGPSLTLFASKKNSKVQRVFEMVLLSFFMAFNLKTQMNLFVEPNLSSIIVSMSYEYDK